MALSDKKVLMVIPRTQFDDREFDVPRRVLESKGIKVTVASLERGEARGLKGTGARPTERIDDVKYYDYDALVFVGGPGARELYDHEKAVKLAKDADHKVLGGIGTGTGVLANAGVLSGKRATADLSTAGLVEAKGATYTGQPIEVAGKTVTAMGASYAEHFGNALIEALEKGS